MKYHIQLSVIILLLFTGCNGFLDESPDNSIEVNTREKITSLLVSAYPQVLPGTFICEYSSDNTDDNGVEWNQFDTRFGSDVYNWRDITEKETDDTHHIWEEYYLSIAAANHALEMIDAMGNPKTLNPQKGEALICRAYCHFVLANIFCKAYGNNSAIDLGIPYMDKVEKNVKPEYKRGTLKKVYQRIDEDIEAALPLIDDEIYKIPKYHFNKKAALAFAARFNLYYLDTGNMNEKLDKVIRYADEVLTDRPTQVTRNWDALYLNTDDKVIANNYISTKEQANLLLHQGNSIWGRTHANDPSGAKYSFNVKIAYEMMLTNQVFWSPTSLYITKGLYATNSYPKIYVSKMSEYFELKDPLTGNGYPHVIYPIFNTDETLICRAEAYALKKEYSNAIKDIQLFLTNFSSMDVSQITHTLINSTYGSMAYYKPDVPTTKMKLNPDFLLNGGDNQENIIHGILNLRRILTLHEGLRWQDIKRYKIVIHRRLLKNNDYVKNTDVLTIDDERRAIQLPSQIISAGMQPNKR